MQHDWTKSSLEHYDVAAYTEIHAYGDSRGDAELLALASKRFFKPFRT